MTDRPNTQSAPGSGVPAPGALNATALLGRVNRKQTWARREATHVYSLREAGASGLVRP